MRPGAVIWRRSLQWPAFGASQSVAPAQSQDRRGIADLVWTSIIVIVTAAALRQIGPFIIGRLSPACIGQAFALGLATLTRVVILIAIASLIWVPIGVWVGTHPRATRVVQP